MSKVFIEGEASIRSSAAILNDGLLELVRIDVHDWLSHTNGKLELTRIEEGVASSCCINGMLTHKSSWVQAKRVMIRLRLIFIALEMCIK